MKKILIIAILLNLFCNPVQAKNFYGEMKDQLKEGKTDKIKHYNAFRNTGQVIRFIPNVFYAQDMAIGLVMLVGGGIELVQAPLPNRDCDLKDFAADWLGLRDGLNGKDFIHDEMVMRAIQSGNQSILDSQELLQTLQKRIEILENK